MSQRTPARTKATSTKTASPKTSASKTSSTKTSSTKTSGTKTASSKAAGPKNASTKAVRTKAAGRPASGAATPLVPPDGMLNAVKLMYAGAVCTTIYMIVNLTGISSIKTSLHQANPKWDAAKLSQAANAEIAYSIMITLVGIALWLLMAWANKRGKLWARMFSTILCALNVLNVIPLVVVRSIDLQTAIALAALALSLVAGIAATFFIWRRESSEFYRAANA